NFFHLPGANARAKYPVSPAAAGNPNAGRKIWYCPSSIMDDAAFNALSGGGKYGFFSYAYNIDLKDGNAPYPNWMPKLGQIKKPSATVLMFDVVYNPVTEIVNS